MKTTILFTFLATALLGACINLFRKPDFVEYAQTCALAEHNRNLSLAERECNLALVTADQSKSDPILKSQLLYNLGRIKRKLEKYSESETLIKASLQIDEQLSTREKLIAPHIVELSASLAGQGKWLEGAQYLKRVLIIAPQFSRQDRIYTSQVLWQYSQHLKYMDQAALAKQFEQSALLLQ